MAYDVLTLAEALQQWCDARLVLQVMEWEPKCTASEVDSLRRIHLTNRGFRRDATLTNVTTNPHMRLRAAWSDLEQDLCRRIEQGLIHLRGVRIAPDKRTDPEIIPGVWAAAFRFDFSRGMITIGDIRFSAVACSLDPWEPEASRSRPPNCRRFLQLPSQHLSSIQRMFPLSTTRLSSPCWRRTLGA